jgi:cytochrome c oxidase assembly protein subunit 15
MAAEALEERAREEVAARWDRAVRIWLWAVAVLVFLMIVVGGATRLTDSGLSITEWQPILGAIPPLNESDWQAAFAKYKAIPEYHLVNKGMSLEAFKAIYWWEWGHRFLGRLIGVAFAVPLAAFWLSGALRPGLGAKLLGVLALGALQGAVGWYMVKSGLVDRVDVSHYRLALHLLIAFAILGLLVWLALDVGTEERSRDRPGQHGAGLAGLIAGLVLLQVVRGALVAGRKAGLAYNTWPLMDGALVPAGLWELSPGYLNLFENVAMVQFNHRLAAYGVSALVLLQLWRVLRTGGDGGLRLPALWLAGAVIAEVGLGIATLLNAVPLSLGLAHQGGAAIVFALAVWNLHVAVHGAHNRPSPLDVREEGVSASRG